MNYIEIVNRIEFFFESLKKLKFALIDLSNKVKIRKMSFRTTSKFSKLSLSDNMLSTHISMQDQHLILPKILYLAQYKARNIPPIDIIIEFIEWLNEAKNINPSLLQDNKRQAIVDKLFNSPAGTRGLYIISRRPYENWLPSTKAPIFVLLSDEKYNKNIETDWCIKLKTTKKYSDSSIFPTYEETFVVVPKKI